MSSSRSGKRAWYSAICGGRLGRHFPLEVDGEQLAKQGSADFFGSRRDAVLDFKRLLVLQRLLECLARGVNPLELLVRQNGIAIGIIQRKALTGSGAASRKQKERPIHGSAQRHLQARQKPSMHLRTAGAPLKQANAQNEPGSRDSCPACLLAYNASLRDPGAPKKEYAGDGESQLGGRGENSSQTAGPASPGDGGRRMVILALLLAMMVTAVEQLVVSPAMATIIAQLKGFEIFPWVASAYLLAATVSTPIYGKLADLFGRKPVLLFGLGLFSVGSVLSGTSMSMPQLIAMRTIQGLGAGAVGPIVLTMLGDMFTLKERAQVQAVFSAVWGLSSIGGPLVGGYLTDFLGWRWSSCSASRSR